MKYSCLCICTNTPENQSLVAIEHSVPFAYGILDIQNIYTRYYHIYDQFVVKQVYNIQSSLELSLVSIRMQDLIGVKIQFLCIKD